MKVIKEGSCVIVYLQNPREQFWGMLLTLDEKGVMIRGGGLESVRLLLKESQEERASLFSTIFFPSHRIEKILLDEGTKDSPSIEESITDGFKKSKEEILGLKNQNPNP
ncbi:MAG: hypothetical protein ACUVUG_01585 [Candidatus Aminicenantia bacterium]